MFSAKSATVLFAIWSYYWLGMDNGVKEEAVCTHQKNKLLWVSRLSGQYDGFIPRVGSNFSILITLDRRT